MDKTTLRWCLLIGTGFLVGSIAWSGYLPAIPFSLLVFLLLGRLGTRQRVLGLMVAYYAGATWQVVPGGGAFFGHHANLLHVFLLWMGISIVLGLAWIPLTLLNRTTRLYTVPLTILLLAVPPLGLIGIASPLTAAGILFPGTAWLGLLLTLLICGLLASYPIYGFAVAILFSLRAQLVYREPQAPSDWQAVSTHFGGVGLDTPSPLAEYEAAQSIQEMALSSSARVIVFPETVVSDWNDATDAYWARTIERLTNEGKTILVGANISDTETQHYFNAVVIRGVNKQEDFLQRIPIPFAMWTPGSDRGVPLRLAARGTLQIAGRRAAVLICYEHLLIWPIMTSFKDHPSLLVGVANAYWARSTTVPDIQRACLNSWARLFDIPMLWAENT